MEYPPEPRLLQDHKPYLCRDTPLVRRSSIDTKLPGQGDNEFLHFDFNPFASARQYESDNDDATPKGLCGKATRHRVS